MSDVDSGRYEMNAFYEDSEGRLWRWACLGARVTLAELASPPPFQWFPCAYTGPVPVPHPVEPMRLVYDEHGFNAQPDGGMYAHAAPASARPEPSA